MFYKSLFSLGFFIISAPIAIFTSDLNFDKFNEVKEKLNIYILFVLFKIFSSFFQSISIFNIIYTYTPIHVGFLNVVSSLFQMVLIVSNEKEIKFILLSIVYIICLIFIDFGTLLFTEIITINACGLNEYTKAGLRIKELLDNCPPDSTMLIEYNDINNEDNDNRHNSEDIDIRKNSQSGSYDEHKI